MSGQEDRSGKLLTYKIVHRPSHGLGKRPQKAFGSEQRRSPSESHQMSAAARVAVAGAKATDRNASKG